MTGKFETYELVPPRVLVWRINDTHDLVEVAESCKLHEAQEGFRYYTSSYSYSNRREQLTQIEGFEVAKDNSYLFYTEYRSAYGDSVDSFDIQFAKVGYMLVFNPARKIGVFRKSVPEGLLDATDLPEELLLPTLQVI